MEMISLREFILLIYFVCWLSPHALVCQIFGSPQVILKDIEYSSTDFILVSGDMNNDHLVDLARLGTFPIIYLNTTRGLFQENEIESPGEGAIKSILDFNNDGCKDIIYSNGILKNDCSGKFLSVSGLDSIRFDLTQEIIDLNGDGLPDLVGKSMLDPKQGYIFVYQNHGDFKFEKHVLDTVPTTFQLISTGDLEGDGDPDLITPFKRFDENGFIIYQNVGPFIFEKKLFRINDILDGDLLSLTDTDQDGDGDVMCSTNSDIILSYENNRCTFDQHSRLSFPNSITLKSHDLNDDQAADLIMTFPTPTKNVLIGYILNDGDGSFQSFQPVIEIPDPEKWIGEDLEKLKSLLLIDDLNGDRMKDLVVQSPLENTVYASWNQKIQTTSIQNEKQDTIYIFPNPASEKIYVRSTNLVKALSIHVQTGECIQLENANSSAIDISNLFAGLYFLKIHLENKKVLIRPFVKF